MAWQYLIMDEEGDLLAGSPSLPGERTAYLGFDVCRNAVVIGYTERGGYHSMLDPNVNDDCNIVAFAPFSEKESPDMAQVHAKTPYKDAFLGVDQNGIILMR